MSCTCDFCEAVRKLGKLEVGDKLECYWNNWHTVNPVVLELTNRNRGKNFDFKMLRDVLGKTQNPSNVRFSEHKLIYVLSDSRTVITPKDSSLTA